MKIVIANTFNKKLIGLMFKKNITYGMYFPKVNKIHTFFMKENIDIYGLDKDNNIITSKLNIKPNKIIILKNAKNTLEIPINLNKKYKIGDKIKL